MPTSPRISDCEEKEIREDENFDVEDSQRTRPRSEPETGWWQEAVTCTVKDDEGGTEGQPNESPKTEQRRRGYLLSRRGTWLVTGPVQSSSWWFLCRSSPGRAMAVPIRPSRGPPRPATSQPVPASKSVCPGSQADTSQNGVALKR